MQKIIGRRYAGRPVSIGDQVVRFDAEGEATGPFTARCLEQARKCDDRLQVVGLEDEAALAAPQAVEEPATPPVADPAPEAKEAPAAPAEPGRPRRRQPHKTP